MTKLFIPLKVESKEKQLPDLENLNKFTVERRFGRTPYYLLVDTDSEESKLIRNSNHHFGGSDSPWEIAMNNNTDAVLAAHLGSSPYNGFYEAGIPIYKVDLNREISDLINQYKSGALKELEKPADGTCCGGKSHNHNH